MLLKLMRLALPKGYVKVLPKFTMDREPNRERKLTAEEYTGLLEKSPVWLRRVCIAANETALSRGDLLGLNRDEADWKAMVIGLRDGRDKSKVRQEIPIRTPALTELFKELEAEYKRLPNTEGLYVRG